MYYIYVLKSRKNNKKYIGFTSRNVLLRLREHNTGCNAWTRFNRPFDLIYHEEYHDEFFARKREKFLKSGHGREFLKRKFGT
jgi:putative endonuclease